MRTLRRGALPLVVAFLVTAAAAFLGTLWNMLEPRWTTPMGTKVMLAVAALAACGARLLVNTPPGATILTVGLAVPVGAFFAMVLEMLKDPTSQNLWPIAVVMLAAFGLAASVIGTLVGGLVRRLLGSK
jgi:hypothetical protein